MASSPLSIAVVDIAPAATHTGAITLIEGNTAGSAAADVRT